MGFIKDLRNQGMTVHGNAIRSEAKKRFPVIYPTKDLAIFRASYDWLKRFMRRNNLVERRVTSVGQKIPENAQELARNWLKNIKEIREQCQIVGNIDEIPMWFDLPSTTSIDFKGMKTIQSRTTGKEKLRYTVVLIVLSTGQKLPPMVISED